MLLARGLDPFGGTDSLPFPSSPDGITAVDLVKPKAERPRAAAGRWRPDACALLAVAAPAAPRPLLGLLGAESPGDPACTGRLPTALGRRCAEGWLRSPCPPPPLPCGAAHWLPSYASGPSVGWTLRSSRRLRCRCGRPSHGRCPTGGRGEGLGAGPLPLLPGAGEESRGGGGRAERPLLGSRSGSRVAGKGGGGEILWL